MVDIHSHILPGVDDGSKNVQESLRLLQMLQQQGVHTVAATPHFYPVDRSVQRFLDKRQAAWDQLQPALMPGLPPIRLGAEVLYYEGISRLPELSKLCIGGSKLLLLEMPMDRWTDRMVQELLYMSGASGYQLVLAHIERYLPRMKRSTLDRLVEQGILIQSNASFFIRLGSRRQAISLLQGGRIHLLGSDCHDLASRPPKIGDAFQIISHKLGREFVQQMHGFSSSLMNIK